MLTQVVYTISRISATFWSWMISPAYHIAVPFRSFPISIVRHPVWTTETDMSLQGCVSLLMTVAMVDAFLNSLIIRTFHSIFGHRSVTWINKAAKITKANCGRTQIIHTVSHMSAAFRSWWISHACYKAVWLRSFPIFIVWHPVQTAETGINCITRRISLQGCVSHSFTVAVVDAFLNSLSSLIIHCCIENGSSPIIDNLINKAAEVSRVHCRNNNNNNNNNNKNKQTK